MARLIVPDEQNPGSAADASISGAGSGLATAASIGQTEASAADSMSRLAQIGGSGDAAEAVAKTGDIGKIMGAGAQAAAGSYADIGNTAYNAGQGIMKMGEQYFDAAEGAIQDSIYNNAYAKASTEFSQRVSERLSKPYDDKGNPTFGTLSSDIAAIGADVSQKYGSGLGNPEVMNKFNTNFGELTTSQQISGLKEARSQQIDYAKGSLQTNLQATTNNGLTADPTMVPAILAQGYKQVDNAVAMGVYTYDQGVLQKEVLRKGVNVGRIELQAQKDPGSAAATLNNQTNDQLGITPMERGQLIDKTTARIKEANVAARMQARETANLATQKYNYNAGELELGIDKGTIKPSDISDSYAAGGINHYQYVKLTEKSMKTQGDTAAKMQQRSNITSAMSNGQILQGKFGDGAINDHYQYNQKLQGGNVPLFDPAAPIDKARMVSQYKAPVSDFTKELSATILTGSTQDVLAAVKANQYVQEKNPIALSSMDDKSRAFLYSVQQQLTYTKGDPATIINNARTNILQADPTAQEARAKAFDKEDKFTGKNLPGTIAGMTSTGGFLGFGSTSMDADDQQIIGGILKQNYMLTGDAQQAIDLTKQKTQGIFGPTTVNPGKSGANMFMPPEFSYPQYNFSVTDPITGKSMPAMRVNLLHDTSPFLKDEGWAHQADVDPATVAIVPNKFASSRQLGQTSYIVTGVHKGSTVATPLINPETGSPLTWTPDDGFIKGLKTTQYNDAKAAQVSSQERPDAINDTYGQPSLQPTQADPATGQPATGIKNTTPLSMGVGTQSHVIHTALQFLGISEVAHRQFLGQAIQKMTNMADDPATTPWCAGFVNMVLGANGIKGTGSLAALSFANFGEETKNPQQGDIVVFNHGGGHGHVGLFMGNDGNGHIKVLGGNQGNMVTIASYPAAAVMTYRKLPDGAAAQQFMQGNDQSQQQDSGSSAQPTKFSANMPNNMNPGTIGSPGQGMPNSPNPQEAPNGGDVPMALGMNKALPLGIRQNNPGNVAKNGNQWDNELPNADNNFKKFATPEDGIAAIARTLNAYSAKYQIDTIAGIVHRYSATDQGEYAKNLSNTIGAGQNEHLNLQDLPTMVKLVKGIIKQENGYIPYNDQMIVNGILRNKYTANQIPASRHDNIVTADAGTVKLPDGTIAPTKPDGA